MSRAVADERRGRPEPARVSGDRRALGLVSLAAVLANSTWFSATAVIPALERDWDLDPSGAAWLVVAVQLGFIAGNVGSALLNLADRIEPRRLIAASAITAASANAGLLGAGGLAAALPARLLVGAALAGVYAPCVRLVASHFERARGTATAAVVGALTVGSGLPHLVRGAGNVPWQATIVATSALAVLAALAVHSVPVGPSAPAGDTAARPARRRPRACATARYGGPRSATWGTCGSSTPCGHGYPRSSPHHEQTPDDSSSAP